MNERTNDRYAFKKKKFDKDSQSKKAIEWTNKSWQWFHLSRFKLSTPNLDPSKRNKHQRRGTKDSNDLLADMLTSCNLSPMTLTLTLKSQPCAFFIHSFLRQQQYTIMFHLTHFDPSLCFEGPAGRAIEKAQDNLWKRELVSSSHPSTYQIWERTRRRSNDI